MLYKIILRKQDRFGCYSFFLYDQTTQYEVMRHWCKFFDERYKQVNKVRNGNEVLIYYAKDYTIY